MQQYNFPDCPLPPGSNVIPYARVSPGPRQDATSQIDYLIAYMDFYQLNCVKMFVDKALTGSTVAGRDELAALVKYAANLPSGVHVDGILFYSSSRMSRDVDDGPLIRTLLRMRGYQLIFINDSIPTGMEGRIVESALDYAAQKYRDELRESVKRGHRFVRQLRGPDGKYLSIVAGRVPFGFLSEKFNTGLKKNNGEPRILTRLIGPDPELAPTIRQAYRLRADRWRIKDIERELGLFGWDVDAPPVPGITARFTAKYRYLFSSEIYKGTYRYQEKIYLQPGELPPNDEKVYSIKKDNPLLSDAPVVRHFYLKTEYYKDFVEPIVTPEMWDAVQNIRVYKPRHGTAKNHVFSGICYCGHCNSEMYSFSRSLRNRYRYYLYACRTRLQRGKNACNMREFNAVRLDNTVFDTLYQLMDYEFIAELVDRVNAELLGEASKASHVEKYHADIANLKQRRARLLNLVMDGDEDAESAYRTLGLEVEGLEKRLQAEQYAVISPLIVDREQVLRTLDDLKTSQDCPDIKAKQRLGKRLISRINIFDNGKKHVADIIPNIGSFSENADVRPSEPTLNSLIPPIRIELPTMEELKADATL